MPRRHVARTTTTTTAQTVFRPPSILHGSAHAHLRHNSRRPLLLDPLRVATTTEALPASKRKRRSPKKGPEPEGPSTSLPVLGARLKDVSIKPSYDGEEGGAVAITISSTMS